MTATAAMIASVRRKTAELTTATYSDSDIQSEIEKYPLVDDRGEEAFTWDTSTQPPTQDANEDWIITYDLNAAAAIIWGEKAGLLAGNFDFAVDGGNFSRNQAFENAMKQTRHFQARRSPTTMKSEPWPRALDDNDIINVNDPRI